MPIEADAFEIDLLIGKEHYRSLVSSITKVRISSVAHLL